MLSPALASDPLLALSHAMLAHQACHKVSAIRCHCAGIDGASWPSVSASFPLPVFTARKLAIRLNVESYCDAEQEQRVLRAVDVIRLERDRPETAGNVQHRHHLHHLGHRGQWRLFMCRARGQNMLWVCVRCFEAGTVTVQPVPPCSRCSPGSVRHINGPLDP